MLVLHLAELRQLVDRLVELVGRNHERDHAGANRLVGLRVGLGVGPGDEAVLALDQGPHVRQTVVEASRRDADGELPLPDHLRALHGQLIGGRRTVIVGAAPAGIGLRLGTRLGKGSTRRLGAAGCRLRLRPAARGGRRKDHRHHEKFLHDAPNDRHRRR